MPWKKYKGYSIEFDNNGVYHLDQNIPNDVNDKIYNLGDEWKNLPDDEEKNLEEAKKNKQANTEKKNLDEELAELEEKVKNTKEKSIGEQLNDIFHVEPEQETEQEKDKDSQLHVEEDDIVIVEEETADKDEEGLELEAGQEEPAPALQGRENPSAVRTEQFVNTKWNSNEISYETEELFQDGRMEKFMKAADSLFSAGRFLLTGSKQYSELKKEVGDLRKMLQDKNFNRFSLEAQNTLKEKMNSIVGKADAYMKYKADYANGKKDIQKESKTARDRYAAVNMIWNALVDQNKEYEFYQDAIEAAKPQVTGAKKEEPVKEEPKSEVTEPENKVVNTDINEPAKEETKPEDKVVNTDEKGEELDPEDAELEMLPELEGVDFNSDTGLADYLAKVDKAVKEEPKKEEPKKEEPKKEEPKKEEPKKEEPKKEEPKKEEPKKEELKKEEPKKEELNKKESVKEDSSKIPQPMSSVQNNKPEPQPQPQQNQSVKIAMQQISKSVLRPELDRRENIDTLVKERIKDLPKAVNKMAGSEERKKQVIENKTKIFKLEGVKYKFSKEIRNNIAKNDLQGLKQNFAKLLCANLNQSIYNGNLLSSPDQQKKPMTNRMIDETVQKMSESKAFEKYCNTLMQDPSKVDKMLNDKKTSRKNGFLDKEAIDNLLKLGKVLQMDQPSQSKVLGAPQNDMGAINNGQNEIPVANKQDGGIIEFH